MANPDQTPEVVIGVATFRRPAALARLLPELVAQLGDLDGPASVVVVDNDPAGGAREQVGALADRGVRYVHEPRPGIAAARNRAIAEAGDADLLVFVDDDRLPTPGWLGLMIRVRLRARGLEFDEALGLTRWATIRWAPASPLQPRPPRCRGQYFDRLTRSIGTNPGLHWMPSGYLHHSGALHAYPHQPSHHPCSCCRNPGSCGPARTRPARGSCHDDS